MEVTSPGNKIDAMNTSGINGISTNQSFNRNQSSTLNANQSATNSKKVKIESGKIRLNKSKQSNSKIGIAMQNINSRVNIQNTNNAGDSATPMSSNGTNGVFMTSAGSKQGTREGNESKINGDKSDPSKKLPAGVRLYNQSKNKPKIKGANKLKTNEPIKQVLTKAVEEMLIRSNYEK